MGLKTKTQEMSLTSVSMSVPRFITMTVLGPTNRIQKSLMRFCNMRVQQLVAKPTTSVLMKLNLIQGVNHLQNVADQNELRIVGTRKEATRLVSQLILCPLEVMLLLCDTFRVYFTTNSFTLLASKFNQCKGIIAANF